MTATAFLERLSAAATEEQRVRYQRFFPARFDEFVGVPMGAVFALAKEFVDLSPDEIEALLDSPVHEARAGAVSVMAKQYALRRTTDDRRRALYELYLRRHDRIDDWDLVDLGAWKVVGAWLADKPRDVLYELAAAPTQWPRRTAVLATLRFTFDGSTDDAFALAGLLLHDPEDLMHKATGWALREAGRVDRPRLLAFLDEHAATMPRVTLRAAIEHLDDQQRAHYRSLTRRAGRT